MASTAVSYPANLAIDYSEKSDRLTVLFRLILVIPILIILGLLVGLRHDSEAPRAVGLVYYGAGFIFAPTLLMILFRKKYPKWWFDWNLAMARFTARVFTYLLLLRDEYPSTDEEQAVHLEIAYPNAATELGRGMPLVKWLLAIPHLAALTLLGVAVIVCTMFSWFVILFTGNYPRDLFNFVVGVMRWSLRVETYAVLLTTDRYPPFSLSQ